MSGSDEHPLRRWSRRKQLARNGKLAEPSRTDPPDASVADAVVPDLDGTVAPDASPPSGGVSMDGAPDEESSAEELSLPPVESLTQDSDYTVFLAEKVPEAIRTAALRKLWRSDPVLANLDGLNDYDEDFSLAAELVDLAAPRPGVGKDSLLGNEGVPPEPQQSDAAGDDDASEPDPALPDEGEVESHEIAKNPDDPAAG